MTVEKIMETSTVSRGHIGIMEKNVKWKLV